MGAFQNQPRRHGSRFSVHDRTTAFSMVSLPVSRLPSFSSLSSRLTLRTLPALREAISLGLGLRGCVAGCTTDSSADGSETGQIDRSRRRGGCAGNPRHRICTGLA
jgi:hypothetical protein